MITPEGNGQWTGMIVGPALARGYKLLPDFSYEPWLFDKDCTVPTVSPFTVDCTIRPEAKWSDNVRDHRRRLQVHVRHDHEPEEQRRHAQRLRQDHASSTSSVPPSSRWCSRRSSPRSVTCGRARARSCCRSTCSRARTSTRSGTPASATRRRRSRSAAARCSCSRSSPTSRSRWCRTPTTGARRPRSRRSCSSRSPTATARSTRSAPVRST